MNVAGASGDHKNPEDYFGREKDIEGTLDDITEKEKDSLIDSIRVTPEYCPDRADALRLHVSINGKNVGYLNDDINKITVNAEFDYNGDFTIG